MRRHMMFTRLGAQPELAGSASPPPTGSGGIVLDTTVGTVTGPVLEAGQTYTVTVTGTVSDWNRTLPAGKPEPDAMYPTTGGEARRSKQVGLDADTVFADPSTLAHKLGHWTQFQIGTGSGPVHVEPEGGPYTTPAPGHRYTYKITGEGKPVVFKWADSPLADNYGAFHITVSGGSSPPPPPPPPPPTPVPVGALILGDEFNGAAGTKPDTKLWTARTGNSNGLAHYDGETMLELDGNGNLKVTCQLVNGTWQSGFISTIPKPYSGPRYMETRAQVAAGAGAWSAPLWEWHAPFGAGGIENDVCEQLGRQPGSYHATLHNWTTSAAPQNMRTIPGPVFASGFHVYGAAVYPDRVDYYLDGALVATATASSVGLTNLTTYQMVAVIDLNIGGWGGTPAAGLTSIDMLVDYVHVYALP